MPIIGSQYGWRRILVLDEKVDDWWDSAASSPVLVGLSGMLKQVRADHSGHVFVNTDDDAIAMNYVAVTSPVKCRNRAGLALAKCARTMLSPELDILRPNIVIYRGLAENGLTIGLTLKRAFI